MSLRKIFVGFIALFMANSMVISIGFAQETNQNQKQSVQKNADSAEVSPEEILKIEETVEKELKELEKKQASNQKAEKKPQNQQADPQKNNQQQTDSQKNDQPKTESAKEAENQKAADSKTDAKEEKADVKEENIATVTAEGDFIVPTYMLPAKEDLETAPQNTADENKASEAPQNAPDAPQNAPVNKVLHQSTVKITQTELTPVAEQMAVERFLTGKTTKTMKAYKEALARQKAAQKAEQAQTKENGASENAVNENVANDSENKADAAQNDDVDALLADETSKEAKKPKKRLLLPLRPLPSKTPPAEDLSGTEPLFKVVSSTMADQVLKDAQDQTRSSLLMPQDIKVTFYPDSAEFSGQAVKWIKAFALQALNDPRRVVEIRLSQYSPTVQQKRLYVVQRLLMNSGLSAHQIVVDYVNRPADSLILRTVEKIEPVQKRKIEMKNGKVKENETIIW